MFLSVRKLNDAMQVTSVFLYSATCVIGRGCLLWPVCYLGKTLLAFALLHFVHQGQTCLLLHVSLDFLLCVSVPCDEKSTFFLGGGSVSSRRSCRYSNNCLASSSSALVVGAKTWISVMLMFVLEMSWNHSVIFEIASRYCISNSCWLSWLFHFF